jgi:hypothetical protein
MKFPTTKQGAARVLYSSFLMLALAGNVVSGHAQQSFVSRYDVYTGFADLYSPELGLNQPGFHTQAGLNMRPWYSMGFDYSVASGSEVLRPDLLPTALQQEISVAIQEYEAAGILPSGYQLAIPADAFTQTFAAGPQLMYRHYTKATFFIRPSLGALRERATPHPTDPFSTSIAEQLAPSGSKLDWTGFYGVGAGTDFAVTKHIGIRAQLDAVYNHPFNDILENGRWTLRYSVGPSFHFGHNVLATRKVAARPNPVSSFQTSSSRP